MHCQQKLVIKVPHVLFGWARLGYATELITCELVLNLIHNKLPELNFLC